MAQYLVTSDRLNGLKRGDIVEVSELEADVKYLLDAGHISPHTPKKSAKTKDTDTDKD